MTTITRPLCERIFMTPQDGKVLIEANRAILSGKLIFGNAKQIAALHFLDESEEYRQHLVGCDSCLRYGMCWEFDVSDEIYAAARALDDGVPAWIPDGKRLRVVK